MGKTGEPSFDCTRPLYRHPEGSFNSKFYEKTNCDLFEAWRNENYINSAHLRMHVLKSKWHIESHDISFQILFPIHMWSRFFFCSQCKILVFFSSPMALYYHTLPLLDNNFHESKVLASIHACLWPQWQSNAKYTILKK